MPEKQEQPESHGGVPDDIAEALQRDFFADAPSGNADEPHRRKQEDTPDGGSGGDGDQPPSEGEGTDDGGDDGQDDAPDTVEGAEPSDKPRRATEQPPEDDPAELKKSVAVLTATVAALQEQLKAPKQEAPAGVPQQGQKTEGSKDPLDEMPAHGYAFAVPDSIVNDIASEDAGARKRALQQLGVGLGRAVHQNVTKLVKQRFEGVAGQIGQAIAFNNFMQTVHNDFYGTHEDLYDPSLFPVVQQITGQVLQEKGKDVTGWDPKLRDEIAKRVRVALGRPDPKAQGKGKPNGRGGAYQGGPGTRPSGAGRKSDNVMDELF